MSGGVGAVQERVKLDENIDDNGADGGLDAIVPFRALLGLEAREWFYWCGRTHRAKDRDTYKAVGILPMLACRQ